MDSSVNSDLTEICEDVILIDLPMNPDLPMNSEASEAGLTMGVGFGLKGLLDTFGLKGLLDDTFIFKGLLDTCGLLVCGLASMSSLRFRFLYSTAFTAFN
jgi:hypothetical protein